VIDTWSSVDNENMVLTINNVGTTIPMRGSGGCSNGWTQYPMKYGTKVGCTASAHGWKDCWRNFEKDFVVPDSGNAAVDMYFNIDQAMGDECWGWHDMTFEKQSCPDDTQASASSVAQGTIAMVNTEFNHASNGVFTGTGMRITSGYVDTKRTFQRPVDMSVDMLQVDTSSDECGVVALFPPSTGRHSGYNAGVGWWGQYFGTGAPGATTSGKMPSTTKEWHTVRINAAADGKVYFYVDGELRRTVDHNQYQSGVIRLGNNCRNFEYKNLVVTEQAQPAASWVELKASNGASGGCSPQGPWYETTHDNSGDPVAYCKARCASSDGCVKFETKNTRCELSKSIAANQAAYADGARHCYVKI